MLEGKEITIDLQLLSGGVAAQQRNTGAQLDSLCLGCSASTEAGGASSLILQDSAVAIITGR